MRNLRLALAALAVMAVVPSVTQAQVATGKFKWYGTGNSFAWWWNTPSGGRHVMGGGAYQAQFQQTGSGWTPAWMWPAAGTNNFGPAVDIYCVDFLHTARGSYDAYFTKLTAASFAGGAGSVMTRSGDLTKYLKAAWLITKMNAPTTSNLVRADIHAAIWQIMSGQPTGTSWNNSNGDYHTVGRTASPDWISQADANYTSINGDEWTVVTDRCVSTTGVNGDPNGHAGNGFNVSDSCSQEFLTQNVVPEPATMILLGTGLLATLAVAGVFRRPEA